MMVPCINHKIQGFCYFATKILMKIGLLVSAENKNHFYNFNFKIRLDRYYMWSIIYIETFHVYGVDFLI